MSNSMFVQYDGEIPNPEALRLELRGAGIEALSVTSSRWVRTDPDSLAQFDAGGRIDVELPFELRHNAVVRIAALSAVMAASPLVAKP